jgi:hypothetical protein
LSDRHGVSVGGAERRPRLHETLGRGLRVGDLECHTDPGGCRLADLDLVDHAPLGRVCDLQGCPAGVEDGDASLAVALEGGLLGKPQYVAVERDRLVVVLGLDDEAKLEDGSFTGCAVAHHRSR